MSYYYIWYYQIICIQSQNVSALIKISVSQNFDPASEISQSVRHACRRYDFCGPQAARKKTSVLLTRYKMGTVFTGGILS